MLGSKPVNSRGIESIHGAHADGVRCENTAGRTFSPGHCVYGVDALEVAQGAETLTLELLPEIKEAVASNAAPGERRQDKEAHPRPLRSAQN